MNYPVVPSINRLFLQIGGCGPDQTCTQESEGLDLGTCECLSTHTVKADRTCMHRDLASVLAQPRVASTASSSGGMVGGVVAVLLVLALVVVAVLAIHRLRLIPRLKARLSSTPYEDIVISDRQGVVGAMTP